MRGRGHKLSGKNRKTEAFLFSFFLSCCGVGIRCLILFWLRLSVDGMLMVVSVTAFMSRGLRNVTFVLCDTVKVCVCVFGRACMCVWFCV